MNKYCPQPKDTRILYENVPGATYRTRDGKFYMISKQGVRYEVPSLFEVPTRPEAGGRPEGTSDLPPVAEGSVPTEQGKP